MVRAWKNKHGVVMGGLLLDTLAHNFFQKTTDHDSATTATFDRMIRDFFLFLSEEEDHDHYQALGSNQDVKVKRNFQRKAKTACELCLKAIDAEGTVAVNGKWKKIFGQSIPNAENAKEAASAHSFSDTEEFIDDLPPWMSGTAWPSIARSRKTGFAPTLFATCWHTTDVARWRVETHDAKAIPAPNPHT